MDELLSQNDMNRLIVRTLGYCRTTVHERLRTTVLSIKICDVPLVGHLESSHWQVLARMKLLCEYQTCTTSKYDSC